jgi:serine/threonine-protein kinase
MTEPIAPLTAQDWARVQEVFALLTNRSETEQREAVERLAQTEPVVARHVQAILVASLDTSTFDIEIANIVEDVLLAEAAALHRQRFGPYRLVKEVGRGGMGIVYLAHRDDLDARAAIKILPNAWIDPARREHFLEEMRILAALSHPSIARLFHADHLPDGTPWFAMEYVQGRPITEWVWERRRSLDEILRLFDRLCVAVQHAHGHPVIHRDLKPSNVLVTEDGTVKLLDFGIAKRYHERPGADEQSRTTTREVSLPYAAPEQLRGRVAGVRADVYALGVILYELLTGRRPYDVSGLTAADVEAAIRAAYPPRLAHPNRRGRGDSASLAAAAHPDGGVAADGSSAPRPVSLGAGERRDLEALLSAAMAPEVTERYGSVEELRGDIERILRQEPLRARNAGWSYRAQKFVRRHWRTVAGAVAAAVIAAAGLLVHNRELAASRDVAIAEAARVDRLRQFLEDLFQGGRQPTGPPDSIRVATLVENGIREARALSTDPAMQVDLLGTLGIMSERMGDLARADSLYLLATGRATALYGPNHPETLRIRVRRARLLAQFGKIDSSEHELRALEVLARRHAPPGHPVVAEVNTALGTLLRERGQFPEAIARLERALELNRARDSTSREYAASLRELGNAVGSAGDLARADSLWLRALPLVRQLFGPKHPDVAFLLADLGNTASQRGRLEEAERYQREAAAITAAWYGEHSELTGVVNGVLAQTLIRLKRYDEAIPLIHQTIEAFSQAPDLGPNSANTAIAHSTLATAFSGRGDHREALHEYERSLAGLRATLGDRDRNTITVAGNLATELLRTGHADSSVAMLRRLIPFAANALGESHVAVANIRIKLGESLIATGQYHEAISVTAAGLRVLDSALGRRAPFARVARGDLLSAYLALGDSANASRMRRELADTLAGK